MEVFQYVGAALIVSFGLFIGLFIAGRAEEELKDGFKYFRMLMLGLFFVVLFLGISNLMKNYYAAALSLIVSIVTIFLPRRIREFLVSSLLAGSFWALGGGYVVSSLIFIHNLAFGTALYKEKRMLWINAAVFVGVSIILYLIF